MHWGCRTKIHENVMFDPHLLSAHRYAGQLTIFLKKIECLKGGRCLTIFERKEKAGVDVESCACR